MLAWMLYVVVVTLVVSAAALSAEKAARLRSARTRWIWVAAMAASLLIPAMTIALALQVPKAASQAWGGQTLVRRASSASVLSPAQWAGADLTRAISSRDLDAWLVRGWSAASAGLALALILSSARLAWRKRAWARRTIAGVPVYVAPDLGPAVVGLLRPQIVVPGWLADLPGSQQSVVIAHELAHVRAGDPQALAAALCALLCAPWNVPLWWQLRRLRRAAEVDCDAGVLRAGVAPRAYAETLLAVGQRQSAPITVIAMSEPRSFLEERITLMFSKPAKSWALVAAACSCLSVTLVAVATQIAAPEGTPLSSTAAAGGPPAAVPRGSRVQLAPAILDGYAGYYQYGEDAEFTTVTRQGDHLMVEFPGVSPLPMYARTPTAFVGEGTDVQIAFTPAADGTAAAAVLQQNGASTPMRRIDAATAARLRSAMAEKIRTQTPNPASEAALRQLIDGIAAGNPDLEQMNPQLAAAIRHDLPKLRVRLANLGAVQAIHPAGVSDSGMDLFEVQHAHGTSQWSLALDAKGMVVGAMVPL